MHVGLQRCATPSSLPLLLLATPTAVGKMPVGTAHQVGFTWGSVLHCRLD